MQAQVDPIIWHSFPVGPLSCNCTIIGDRRTQKAIVVDPGGDADQILAYLSEHAFALVAVIHTHAHLDHFLASGILREKTGAPLYLHDQDLFLWRAVDMQCRMLGIPPISIKDPDFSLKDEQSLTVAGGVTLHIPGHTPGSVGFLFESLNLLIAGDTLFQGSIGRTDLPGGDFTQIDQSIRERIYTLDESLIVITGHGPQTTIAREKYHNPFVRVRL